MGAKHFKLGFGFGFPVERANMPSGFKPVYGEKQPLFADLRIAGWAAAVKAGFIDHLIPLGWYEREFIKYKPGEAEILRPWAQAQMLIHDYGVDPARVEPLETEPNTLGHMVVMQREMRARGLKPQDCAIVTSYYHGPRSNAFALDTGLEGIQTVAAESFLLEAGLVSKERLIDIFSGPDFAKTVVMEIGGLADFYAGRYQVKTAKKIPEIVR